MMPHSPLGDVPHNPFVARVDKAIVNFPEFGVLEIPPGQVPYAAEGFELLADTMDWSEPELRVLLDAAKTIRWTSQTNGVSEYAAVNHRLNSHRGLTLVYPAEIEPVDDKGEKP